MTGHWRPTPIRRADWRTGGGRALTRTVRARAAAGEPCWFWRHPDHPTCPGRIDLTLDGRRDRWAFTVHHLHRRMHGGARIPDQRAAAPAHRACNSRDGLIAQNNRRRTSQRVTVVIRRPVTPGYPGVERTSEDW